MYDILQLNEMLVPELKDIAEKLNITEDDLEYYGKYKAKLPLQKKQKNIEE